MFSIEYSTGLSKYSNNCYASTSDGKIRIHEDEVENDRDVPSDARTAKLFGEIGNSVSNFLKLTTDYPSKHPSGFMPLLDIQVKIEQKQVVYKFYNKPRFGPSEGIITACLHF